MKRETLSGEAREKLLTSKAVNCAQKVFGVFAPAYGLDLEQSLPLAGGLGGGLRIGEVCGALVGALLVVGLKYGSWDLVDPEARKLCDAKAFEVSCRFREANGCVSCRDLLGMDTSLGSNRQLALDSGLFDRVCPGIIDGAIQLLEELGYGHSESGGKQAGDHDGK